MGKALKPLPVKLIMGFIYREEKVFLKTFSLLEKRFGKTDFLSPPIPFTYTSYYQKEFGTNLKRKFASYHKMVDPDRLSTIKLYSNALEGKLKGHAGRLINIDPGYLDLSKLVLATTKDYNHRIYLGKGIYAEITLFYQKNTFSAWPWTYPDYRSSAYINIFNHIRQAYLNQIR
jgi:hypothetical protein